MTRWRKQWPLINWAGKDSARVAYPSFGQRRERAILERARRAKLCLRARRVASSEAVDH